MTRRVGPAAVGAGGTFTELSLWALIAPRPVTRRPVTWRLAAAVLGESSSNCHGARRLMALEPDATRERRLAAQLQPILYLLRPIPIARRSYILRRPARGQGRLLLKAFHAWRKLADFSMIAGLTTGMDERKPLIRLGS